MENQTPLTPGFGMHISQKDGDEFFNKANEIKNQAFEELEKLFTQKEDLYNYYARKCYGYIFNKKSIQELLSKMTSEDDHLVLLNGAKNRGKQTLMAFIYKKSGDEFNLNKDDIIVAGKIGTQHPALLIKVTKEEIIPEKILMDDLDPNS